MGNEARVSRIESVGTASRRRFTASHFGYRDRSIVHTRSVEWNKNGSIQIEDQLSGKGIHSLAIYFHSAPEWRFSQIVGQEHGINCLLEGKRGIYLSVTVAGEIMAEVIPGHVSWVYGSVIPSSTLRIKVTAEFPTRILTTLGWEG
jgi:heparinase II/III-like protein